MEEKIKIKKLKKRDKKYNTIVIKKIQIYNIKINF